MLSGQFDDVPSYVVSCLGADYPIYGRGDQDDSWSNATFALFDIVNRQQAWQKTLDFLDRHTLREIRREIKFEFPSTAVDGPGEYLSHVREKLGPQTGKPPYHVWSLTSAEFGLCLRLALDVDRWPRDAESRFSFCYDFVASRRLAAHPA